MKNLKITAVNSKAIVNFMELEMFVPDRRQAFRSDLSDRRISLRPTLKLRLLGTSAAAAIFGAICLVHFIF